MGCFDTVVVTCPFCKELIGIQSKAGKCMMEEYDLQDAPLEVLGDINNEVHECDCGASLKVSVSYSAILSIVQYPIKEYDQKAVYSVLNDDRHVGVTVHNFSTKDKAIEKAKQIATAGLSKNMKRYKEEDIDEYVFFATYSSEGDTVSVIETIVDSVE